MTNEPKSPSGIEQKSTPGDEKQLTPGNEQEPNPAELLLEQYKLLVDYRKCLADRFLKVAGTTVGISTLLIGLLSGKSQFAVQLALGLGAIIFFLLAFIGYRLRHVEDIFVGAMHEVEQLLDAHGYKVARWPSETGNVGGRIAVVAFLVLVGLGFFIYLVHPWLRLS